MNPSPLRYPGGKYKLYKYVSELIKENNCTTYIEPFCGGAAIALELLCNGIVNDVIINDYDYSIFCFWDSVLHKTEEFIKLIMETEITMNEWRKQKSIRDDIYSRNSLEIGFSTFFLNRTNHSGIIDKAGPIGGFEQKGDYSIDCRFNKSRLIFQIQKIAKLGNHIDIYNLEALDFIEKVILKRKKRLFFLIHLITEKDRARAISEYSHGDHVNLANEIQSRLKNRKWIVTYDNVNAIKAMYAKTASIEFELQYTLQKNI